LFFCFPPAKFQKVSFFVAGFLKPTEHENALFEVNSDRKTATIE